MKVIQYLTFAHRHPVMIPPNVFVANNPKDEDCSRRNASIVVNRLMRKLDLPYEQHYYDSEEDMFNRLWDVQTFGVPSPGTNPYAHKMWMDREHSTNAAQAILQAPR